MSEGPKNSSHRWTADRPLENIEDDLLLREHFADRIAKEIYEWQHSDESLVISLNGIWGSGKTSFKNFVIQSLKRISDKNEGGIIPVVEFNPWRWSGQDKVLEAFFQEVGTVFNKDVLGDAKKAASLARLWEGLRVGTIAVSAVSGKLQESITAVMALLSGGSGVLSRSIENPTAKSLLEWTGIILFTVAAACGIFAPVAEKVAKFFKWNGEKPKKTLDECHDELRKELKTLKKSILVVIDDIDRLTKDETKLMVQLVKANANFPNVIYLLLFQKEIVAAALDTATAEKGHQFLRKIIQVELELPSPPDHMLRKMLLDALDQVHKRAKSRWTSQTRERWHELFEDAVWPYMKTPRDIKRFLSVFDFYFEGHVISGELDVNFTDLILIETLRMFDPAAYEVVRNGFQSRITASAMAIFNGKEVNSRFKDGVDGLINGRGLDPSEKLSLNALLRGMFPQASDGSSMDNEQWDRDSRVCHRRHFPKYFQLTAAPGDIPAAMVSELVEAGDNLELSVKILRGAADDGVLIRLFERIESAKKDFSQGNIESIVSALFSVSDSLPQIEDDGFSEEDGEMSLGRLCVSLLSQIASPEDRGEIFRRTVASIPAVTGPVICFSILKPRESRNLTSETQLDSNVVQAINEILITRLWQAAKNEDIWKNRKFCYMVWSLKNWGEGDQLKKWLTKSLADPDKLSVFLREMVELMTSSGGLGYRKIYSISFKDWSSFVDLDALSEYAKNLTVDEKDELLKAIVRKLVILTSPERVGDLPERAYVISWSSDGRFLEDKHDASF
jgi:KAP family P-loop domain